MKFAAGMIVCLLSSSRVFGVTETIVSKIFPVGELNGKPLFTQTTQIDRESPQSFKSKAKILDAQGRILMTESVEVKNEMLLSQAVEQLQSQEAWDLEVNGKQASYSSFKLSDDKRILKTKNSVKVGENFLNGPMMEMFIAKNWQDLHEGKSLKADFSILELEKAVSFSFTKQGLGVRNGKKVVIVKMAPANFLFSIFVDPLILEFDLEQKRLVYFKGRTPLKDMKSPNRPFDAEILYEISK